VSAGVKLYPVFHRLGDVNGDNKFTITDVVLEYDYVLNGSAENFAIDEADANNDGSISMADVIEILNSIIK
jgi:hypothetical protein